MNIKLTTDWILLNLSHTISTDKKGNCMLCCNSEDYKWVSLAFETLKIKYIEEEIEIEDEDFHYFFEFKIKSIKTKSVELYELLLELEQMPIDETIDNNVPKLDITDNYIRTDNKLFTFDECEKFSSVISIDNLGTLANHLCIKELAETVRGFVEKDGILYFDINGEFVSVTKKNNY